MLSEIGRVRIHVPDIDLALRYYREKLGLKISSIISFPDLFEYGHHYWGQMSNQQTLRLVKSTSLKYGEIYLHYEAVR